MLGASPETIGRRYHVAEPTDSYWKFVGNIEEKFVSFPLIVDGPF